MLDKEPCGTKPCTEVVDRLAALLATQQERGFQSVKELINVHHETLTREVVELKASLKDQGDEIFLRLRTVEAKVKVIEAVDLTEARVKDIVASNETVKWTAGRRSFERVLAPVIAAAIILAILGTGMTMYIDYQKAKSSVGGK